MDEEETTMLKSNRRLVIDHLESFVNKKDLGATDRNMKPDFLDHDGPGGKQADHEGGRTMMPGMHKAAPDLCIEVIPRS